LTNSDSEHTGQRTLIPQSGLFDSTMIMVSILVERPVESFAGIVLTALGLPAYYFWKRKANPADPSRDGGRR
jgi:hypothetical protein